MIREVIGVGCAITMIGLILSGVHVNLIPGVAMVAGAYWGLSGRG